MNEGLGRSRGGLTTKIMMTAVDENTPIAIDGVAGSRQEAARLKPILAKTVAHVGAIDAVVGDKGFDGEPPRQACRDPDAVAVIPAKCRRVNPEPLDKPAYRERNRVEGLLATAKEFRRIATR